LAQGRTHALTGTKGSPGVVPANRIPSASYGVCELVGKYNPFVSLRGYT